MAGKTRRSPEGWAKQKVRHHTRDPLKMHGYRLKYGFGITRADYEVMLEKQSGVCAICGGPPTGHGRALNTYSVDHDHTTGKIRGLLCHHCNLALGQFRDDPDICDMAAAYLRGR